MIIYQAQRYIIIFKSKPTLAQKNNQIQTNFCSKCNQIQTNFDSKRNQIQTNYRRWAFKRNIALPRLGNTITASR